MTPEQSRYETVHAGHQSQTPAFWWFPLIAGILLVLYGMLVLSLRPAAVTSVALLAGIAFIFGGVTQFLIASQVDSWRWLLYAGSVLGIAAGIAAFVWPGITLYVLAVLVSWYLVISGIFHVVSAFAGPKHDWWWTGVVLGLIELALGVWAIGSPEREVLLLVNLVGIWMVFAGFTEIIAALALRAMSRRASLGDAQAS